MKTKKKVKEDKSIFTYNDLLDNTNEYKSDTSKMLEDYIKLWQVIKMKS